METITSAAGGSGRAVSSLAGATRRQALTRARTCYDHLAGRLGVASLGCDDRPWARQLGPRPRRDARRRRVARGARRQRRACDHRDAPPGAPQLPRLDRAPPTPRRIGRRGTSATASIELGWTVRGTGRAIRLTPAGAPALAAALGVDPADLAPAPPRDTGAGRA